MDFANIRINGEKKARNESKSEEVTLSDIYSYCDFTGITQKSKDEILHCEIELEKRLIVPVRSMIEQINHLRSKGCQVLFITDIYLPESVILDCLTINGFYQPGDKLYVSCEFGFTKRTGNLFKYIQSENHYAFNNWMHTGDNLHSDIQIPQNLGIKHNFIKHNYSYYEQEWINKSYSSSFPYAHILAGISKSIRLERKQDIQIDFTVNLIAPLYTCHVYRILESAQKQGINCLFFLARDGFVLYLIAKKLVHLFPSIRLEYIYASRKSLYLSGIYNLNDCDLFTLLDPVVGHNLYEILDRLNIDFDLLASKEKLSTYIDTHNIQEFNDFFNDKKITDYIEQEAEKRREILFTYFCQIGLASHESNNAIVDLRGTRMSHEIINKLLTNRGCKPVKAFYFEVVEDRITSNSYGSYFSDFYSEKMTNNPHLEGIRIHYNLFEQFFSLTDQNRTIGYESKDGKVGPTFENHCKLISNKHQNQIARLHYEIIEQFAEDYSNLKLFTHNDRIYYSVIIPTVSQFGIKPQKSYLDALLNFYESDNIYSYRPYIRKFNWKDWIKIIIFSKKLQNSVGWYQGTLYANMPQKIVTVYNCIFKAVWTARRKLRLIILFYKVK
jgi:predicted HAD superfamily hydrolase